MNKYAFDRLDEERIQRNGLVARIIKYNNANDIDVQFENGCVSKNKKYLSFVNGQIRSPMRVIKEHDFSIIENPQTKLRFIVDNEDVDKILQKGFWSKGCGSKCQYIRNCSKSILLHRFILGIVDEHVCVDHINGNTLDNRKSNLRLCTKSENSKNIHIGEKGFKGCYYRKDKKKWMAQIRNNNKHYYLGIFSTKEDAILAYDNAAKQLHGQFACLNTASA